MTTTVSKIVQELADREAIRECLYRYSRGVDRLDADMVRSAYWPDCIDNHLTFTGNAEEFIDWSFEAMATMDQTQHLIGNILVSLTSETSADAESYFFGIQVVNTPDGEKADFLASGRYVDVFEKRDDEWRVIKRTVVTDWYRVLPGSADWSQGMMGFMIQPGGRYPDDDSYKLIDLK